SSARCEPASDRRSSARPGTRRDPVRPRRARRPRACPGPRSSWTDPGGARTRRRSGPAVAVCPWVADRLQRRACLPEPGLCVQSGVSEACTRAPPAGLPRCQRAPIAPAKRSWLRSVDANSDVMTQTVAPIKTSPDSADVPRPALRSSLAGHALYLDIDGTILDLAPSPEAVEVPVGMVPLLQR